MPEAACTARMSAGLCQGQGKTQMLLRRTSSEESTHPTFLQTTVPGSQPTPCPLPACTARSAAKEVSEKLHCSFSSSAHRALGQVGQGDAKQPPPGSTDQQGRDEDPCRHREAIRPASQEEIHQGEHAQCHGVVGTWGGKRTGNQCQSHSLNSTTAMGEQPVAPPAGQRDKLCKALRDHQHWRTRSGGQRHW